MTLSRQDTLLKPPENLEWVQDPSSLAWGQNTRSLPFIPESPCGIKLRSPPWDTLSWLQLSLFFHISVVPQSSFQSLLQGQLDQALVPYHPLLPMGP